jgi:hypothetical protein
MAAYGHSKRRHARGGGSPCRRLLGSKGVVLHPLSRLWCRK